MTRVFVTGITGQDGSYLAEYLLNQGIEIHGLVRRSSNFNTKRIDHLLKHKHSKLLRLHHGDIADTTRIVSLLAQISPTHVYNLAAQSHVRVSFDLPFYTGEITGLATTGVLEAIRLACPDAFIYQASSSELFGATPPPQNEDSPFYPRSPYAAAKLYSYWIAKNYREAYGLRISNGILFNHESPRRGETFVTRKITRAAARIKLGLDTRLDLGNLAAIRDWGYAPEYVEAMWKMSFLPAGDFVVATGKSFSVKDFLMAAFESLDLNYEHFTFIDDRFFRPTEVDALIGDSKKIQSLTSWRPEIHTHKLAELMTVADLNFEQGISTIDAPTFRY
jgi:GDPmannose 4,6-dehydratase